MNTQTSKKQTVIYTLRLPADLHEKIKKAADELNLSLSAFIKMHFTQALKEK